MRVKNIMWIYKAKDVGTYCVETVILDEKIMLKVIKVHMRRCRYRSSKDNQIVTSQLTGM